MKYSEHLKIKEEIDEALGKVSIERTGDSRVGYLLKSGTDGHSYSDWTDYFKMTYTDPSGEKHVYEYDDGGPDRSWYTASLNKLNGLVKLGVLSSDDYFCNCSNFFTYVDDHYFELYFPDDIKKLIKERDLDFPDFNRYPSDDDISNYKYKFLPELLTKREESVMENTKDFSKYDTIVVHGGLFHADDLMCAAIAKTLNPDIDVIRESRPDKVKEYLKDDHCLVCDVGRGEYDHHQEDALTKEDGTKYCAAGHLYKDFGHLIPMTDKNREIFETMLDSIDRHDNYGSFDSISNMFGAYIPAYDKPDLAMDSHFNLALDLLSDMFDTLDKDFNQDFKGNSELEKRFELERQPIERDFLKIIGTNNEELYNDFVTYTIDFQNELDKKEQEAIKLTNEEYAKGDNSFVCVLSEYRPWEKALAKSPAIYCVYPSMRGGFNVQCVPTHDNDGQGMRLQLPENMKDNDGFIFRHAAGFIGSFETQEQAVSFANEAVTRALENALVAENPFKVYSDIYIGKEPADQDVMLAETQSAVTAFIQDYIADKGYNVTAEELYNMLSSEIDPLLAYSMTQELATSDIIIDNGFFDEEIDEEMDEEL